MTVSEDTLRTLAGLSQGRNVAPAWAGGFGHPDDDSGVDLQNTTLSVVQLVRAPGFFGNGAAFDFVAIESTTIDIVGNPYTLDLDGTPTTHTVVSGDDAASVMDALAVLVNADADYTATRYTYRVASASSVSWEVMRIDYSSSGGPAAPTVIAGLNMVVRASPVANTTYSIWLRQTMADQSIIWSIPSGGQITLTPSDYNWAQRLSTAGFDRIYIEMNELPVVAATYTAAYAAPCTEELV